MRAITLPPRSGFRKKQFQGRSGDAPATKSQRVLESQGKSCIQIRFMACTAESKAVMIDPHLGSFLFPAPTRLIHEITQNRPNQNFRLVYFVDRFTSKSGNLLE